MLNSNVSSETQEWNVILSVIAIASGRKKITQTELTIKKRNQMVEHRGFGLTQRKNGNMLKIRLQV